MTNKIQFKANDYSLFSSPSLFMETIFGQIQNEKKYESRLDC